MIIPRNAVESCWGIAHGNTLRQIKIIGADNRAETRFACCESVADLQRAMLLMREIDFPAANLFARVCVRAHISI